MPLHSHVPRPHFTLSSVPPVCPTLSPCNRPVRGREGASLSLEDTEPPALSRTPHCGSEEPCTSALLTHRAGFSNGGGSVRGGMPVQLTGACGRVHHPPCPGAWPPHLWCSGPRSGLCHSQAALGPSIQNSSDSHRSSEMSCIWTAEERGWVRGQRSSKTDAGAPESPLSISSGCL